MSTKLTIEVEFTDSDPRSAVDFVRSQLNWPATSRLVVLGINTDYTTPFPTTDLNSKVMNSVPIVLK